MSDTPITDQFVTRHPFPFHRGAYIKKLQELEHKLIETQAEWEISKSAWQIEHKIREIREMDVARISAEAAVLRDKLEQAKHLALNIYHGTAQEYRERAVTLVGNLNEFLVSTAAGRDFVRREEYDEMAHRFSCLLDHATGGRISKTNYDKETMYAQVDEQVERQVASARVKLQRTEKE